MAASSASRSTPRATAKTSSTRTRPVEEVPREISAALDEVADEVVDLAEAVGDENDRNGAYVEKESSASCTARCVVACPTPGARSRTSSTSPGTRATSPVGLYDDGMPGELFITMAKEGSTIGGFMDSLGTATSVAMQYGVPLESLVKKFTHQRFEPSGMTTNRDIPFAKSLVDYIFRWLGMEFIEGYREANAPKRPESSSIPSETTLVTRRMGKSKEKAESKSTDRTIEVKDTVISETTVSESSIVTGKNTKVQVSEASTQRTASATLSMALESSGDAPPCDVCGTITVRSGTCYKCLNCGNSLGCS